MVITFECEHDVAVVRIRRPETKNSLQLEQIAELAQAIESVATSGARWLLLTGGGGSFCAGRDVHEVDPLADDPYRIMTTVINPLLRRIYAASKQILAQQRSLDEVLEREASAMHAALRSEDAREGLEAFTQKRRPRFSGR